MPSDDGAGPLTERALALALHDELQELELELGGRFLVAEPAPDDDEPHQRPLDLEMVADRLAARVVRAVTERQEAIKAVLTAQVGDVMKEVRELWQTRPSR